MDQQQMTQAAIQASGLAKKGLQIKFGVVALALFLIGLILLGLMAPGPQASAAGCEDTGPGTDSAAPVSRSVRTATKSKGSIHDQQIANVKTIDKVARSLGLPGRATLIALMTAMQESSLINLDHGDGDSRGLFQQRPSAKWGTTKQIMDPTFAAESFFTGRGPNKGLVDIKHWMTMQPGDAAQAVQKSAHGGLYAGHQSTIKGLAKEAKVDLHQPGKATGKDKPEKASKTDTPASKQTTRCPGPTKDARTGNNRHDAGGTFRDGHQSWTLHNPRSVKAAISWAKAHAGANSTKQWGGWCLKFVAQVYGWTQAGVNYAIDHYTVVPKNMRHTDRHPAPGALMYWSTNHRAGHIAVYLGGGKIASNDILRPGAIDIVDAKLIETKWSATYRGWTPPVFPRAG
ncbi:peptidase M23 [Streptomyces sp. MS1.AVA.3]|uniref:peptidase M23 n=1 Tax=Streptomyces decoyicus TaxID=249567 RepID=UPI0030C30668